MPKLPIPTLLLLTLAWPVLAGEDEGRKAREALQRLQRELAVSEAEAARHRAELRRIERQMECNWELIRGYELCERVYPEPGAERLTCTRRVRQNVLGCLEDTRIGPESGR